MIYLIFALASLYLLCAIRGATMSRVYHYKWQPEDIFQKITLAQASGLITNDSESELSQGQLILLFYIISYRNA